MNEKLFSDLLVPRLPACDLQRLEDGELSCEYEKLAAEILKHNVSVEEVRALIDGLLESDSVDFAELQAAKAKLCKIATAAVSLADAREQLKLDVAAVHRRFAEAAQAKLAEVREQKTIELRALCGGQLPNGWPSTVSEACSTERFAAAWKPASLMEQMERIELAPPARTRDFLRDLVRRELGIENA